MDDECEPNKSTSKRFFRDLTSSLKPHQPRGGADTSAPLPASAIIKAREHCGSSSGRGVSIKGSQFNYASLGGAYEVPCK